MLTKIYYRKALTQIKNKHSFLEEKHSLLENKHSQNKTALSKLQEEHGERQRDARKVEGMAFLIEQEIMHLNADQKPLQADHSELERAWDSLMEEMDQKVLNGENATFLELESGVTY
uniref:Uncharacterized protein n=1 Tax=Phytophthora ramorum TaxID=164328 RepID=H3GD35_PHYRM